ALTEQHEYLPCQITIEGELLFQVVAIPSVGYRLFWQCERSRLSNPTPAQPSSTSLSETSLQVEESAQAIKLRNETLEISFDRTTGQILQLRDLVLQQDCLAQPANCLQCFTDKGQYWDAWNIDPDYEQHQLPAPTLSKLHWLEQGPLRLRLRLVYQFQRSRLQQDLILEAGSPLLKIQMQVDWQEDYVLLKVAFPLHLQASSVTCEAACGVNIYPTQQATQPQTPVEKAQWEVPAHRWADLSSADWGLSILNDCKYGYDAKPDQLRLTLLRSPKWPDPESDRGQHQFAYALYPHAGNWHSAQTVRQGYAFNQPLLACYPTQQPSQVATLPPTKSLLNLGGNSLVLMTLKPAELQSHAANSPATNLPATKTQDIPSTWILRCYESRGESTDLCLHTAFAWASVQSTDLLETDSTEPHPSTVAKILPTTQVSIAPWQIVSLQLIEALA
ncbi:MAG: glycoside hydrolase family 38 C-terminal domain-containing protein, partial [Cyanobacteria bacterium P01_H01_bin.121]